MQNEDIVLLLLAGHLVLNAVFELTDILLQKRRFVTASIYISIIILFICLLAPFVQTYRTNLAARIQSSNANQVSANSSESPNAVMNAFSQIADDTQHAAVTIETNTLSGVMSLATDITHFDKDTMHGAQDSIVFPVHLAIVGVVNMGDTVSNVFNFTGHILADVFGLSHELAHVSSMIHVFPVHVVATGVADTSHTVVSVFDLNGRIMGDVFGLFDGLPRLSSIIQPKDHTPVATITQLRIQQAVLIQSGTQNVSIASMTTGTGGACDDGSGNGGYPMSWCNAPMDTASTIPYTSDPINRECTSYAYWYFTDIEGHTDFRVSGNAKYWAATSNYPTHPTPTIGAIAVETAGAYGHVAIVQALPGQNYAGQVVPAGYVLVSEMNYDWNGHFRYSYSPLSKFSSYIYP